MIEGVLREYYSLLSQHRKLREGFLEEGVAELSTEGLLKKEGRAFQAEGAGGPKGAVCPKGALFLLGN